MEDLAAQQLQLEAERKRKEELIGVLTAGVAQRRSAHAYSTYENEGADKKSQSPVPPPVPPVTAAAPPLPPPRRNLTETNNPLPTDITGHKAATDTQTEQETLTEPVETPLLVANANNSSESGEKRSRRLLRESNDAVPAPINNISPQTAKILLKMENLLILINVWRDSEFGKNILQERGVIILAKLRNKMNEQWGNLRPIIKELELCIVQLFSNLKHGHDIDDSKLNEIISKICDLQDPDTKEFSNTVGNICNDELTAKHTCLPHELFHKNYSDTHRIHDVKFNIRRHIIYKHKFYFEKYDESVLRRESPNTSAQHASYSIQLELANIAQNAGVLDQACAIESNEQEGIQKLVTGIIGRQIGLAGSIPVWFKEDSYFAKTLNIVARYNNHVDDRKKTLPLEKLFMRNPLSQFNYRFDNSALDNRPASEKRQSLITVLLMLSNYYLKKPLGEYFAEALGIDENTQFGQKDRIKKLKRLAELLAFDPQGDEEVINLLIIEIKAVINSFWSSNTRTKNELILLVQHFGSADDKKDLPKLNRNPKRFCKDKDIFDYQIDKAHADEFYKLHFSQEMMKKLSHYHAATSKRWRVSTAVCKDQAMWELEQGINGVYIAPFEKIHEEQIDVLPNGYSRDLPGLINYKMKHIYLTTMSDRIISIQSEFSRTWDKLNRYFSRMIFGKIQQKTFANLQFVPEHNARADSSAAPVAQQNQLASNPDFYVLAARLLAIINAYCDSDLAHDMKLEINYYSRGHKERAENLANFVIQQFLSINQCAPEKNDQEAAALVQLKQEIERVSLEIKEPFLKGSPRSRFAKSLDELINANHVNQSAKSLPFNAAKSIKLFPDNKIDDAKRMIHRHMIDQVCTHYIDFETDIQGRGINKPGEFQQKAVADTRKRLMAISYMFLHDQNTEIAKLAAEKNLPDANMYDLIIDTMGKPIIHCGRIDFGFSDHLTNMLKKVCMTINKFVPETRKKYMEILLVPNQVKRCIGLAEGADPHNYYVNMFRLLASAQIIGRYYLDDSLGKQYADAIDVPYHEKHGWDDDVKELLQLAEELYTRAKPNGESDDAYAKRTMTEILNQINLLITRIRRSFSNNSALANELIFLMTRFGGPCGLHTVYNLTDKRYKENAFLVEPSKLSRDQAEDFMQMNYIQQVSKIVSRFKIGLDRRDSVATTESAILLQMEQNLENLYKMTIGQRRAEMEKLPADKRNITHLVNKYLRLNTPYDFISRNSYVAKTVLHRLLHEVREMNESANKPAVIMPNDAPQVLAH